MTQVRRRETDTAQAHQPEHQQQRNGAAVEDDFRGREIIGGQLHAHAHGGEESWRQPSTGIASFLNEKRRQAASFSSFLLSAQVFAHDAAIELVEVLHAVFHR